MLFPSSPPLAIFCPSPSIHLSHPALFPSCPFPGGQAGLQSIWDKYYDESHAVVYVVDSASEARFEESRAALDRVLGAAQLAGAPVILMANKQVR